MHSLGRFVFFLFVVCFFVLFCFLPWKYVIRLVVTDKSIVQSFCNFSPDHKLTEVKFT